MFWLGIDTPYALHHPKMSPNEAALPFAVENIGRFLKMKATNKGMIQPVWSWIFLCCVKLFGSFLKMIQLKLDKRSRHEENTTKKKPLQP